MLPSADSLGRAAGRPLPAPGRLPRTGGHPAGQRQAAADRGRAAQGAAEHELAHHRRLRRGSRQVRAGHRSRGSGRLGLFPRPLGRAGLLPGAGREGTGHANHAHADLRPSGANAIQQDVTVSRKGVQGNITYCSNAQKALAHMLHQSPTMTDAADTPINLHTTGTPLTLSRPDGLPVGMREEAATLIKYYVDEGILEQVRHYQDTGLLKPKADS